MPGYDSSGRIELRSARLVLRPWTEADAPALRMLAGDWNVARMLSRMPHPYTLDDARAFVAHAQAAERERPRTAWHFAIAEARTGLLVGGTGLHLESQGWETGYWLGELYWGFGFATEACRRMVRFGFEELGLDRIAAGHYADNPASAAVLRKAGFAYAGETMRHCRARDALVRCREMAAERSDWITPADPAAAARLAAAC